MRLGQDVLTDLDRALAHEWLLADGLGGSALGTAASARARSEHALLVAPGPAGAAVALLAVDARATVDGDAHELATHRWTHGGTNPAGHRLLESFTLDPWPVWRYRAGALVLDVSLFLLSDHGAVVVSYRHVSGPAAKLTVSPVVTARGPAELRRENPELHGVVKGQPGRLRIETLPGHPALTLWHNGAFLPARLWQRGHDIEVPERDHEPDDDPAPRGRGTTRAARRGGSRIRRPAFAPASGAPAGDDALAVGYVDAPLVPGGSLHLVASVEEDLFRSLAQEGRLGTPPPDSLAGCVAVLEAHERARLAATRIAAREGAEQTARQAAAAHGGPGAANARRPEAIVPANDPWIERLAGAIECGLLRRGPRLTIAASLPEGDERPDLALRCLPGLISLRAFEPVAAVLRGLSEYLDEGFVPESFDAADGTPRYGDPRPSLWLVHASELFARRSGELELVRESLYPALESVMQYFRAGTRGGVRVDADGLLAAGHGDDVVKHADVNALWYHALVAMSQLARLVGRKESGAFYLAWAREHQMRFSEKFWDDAHGRVAHALGADGAPDRALRPEHVLCASLSPTLLPAAPAKRLLDTIARELFTPLGLRAGPGDPRVHPEWLGPYASAFLRAHDRSAEARSTVRGWFEELGTFAHGDGHLPGAFEVDPSWKPGRPLAGAARPAGAPAAFVAPAEFARVWVEELVHAEDAATVA